MSNATIWTAARLREEGHTAPHAYLVVVTPGDDDAAISLWFRTLDAVIAWSRETRPAVLSAHTEGPEVDIHCDDLIALCRRGTLTH